MKHEFKPADLRIGDVVTYHSSDFGDKPIKINWQCLRELQTLSSVFNREQSPIELTVQVFNKIGFSSRVNQGVIEVFKPDLRYNLIKSKHNKKWLFCEKGGVITQLEFLHELQHLYALLTKTELEVSNLINE